MLLFIVTSTFCLAYKKAHEPGPDQSTQPSGQQDVGANGQGEQVNGVIARDPEEQLPNSMTAIALVDYGGPEVSSL